MKRIIALLLTITLIVLTSGCSGLGIIKRRSYKIAFVAGPQSIYGEDFAEVSRIADRNGSAILVRYLDDDFYTNKKAVQIAIAGFVFDERVKAVIFTHGFEGTTLAVEQLKELRPDIFCIVVNPYEDMEALSAAADMVFALDEDAYARSVVEYAVGAGAQVLVSYRDSRLMQYPNVQRRIAAITAACAEAGIELDLADDVDYRKGYGIDGARMFVAEDVPRKLAKHKGKKIALHTNEYAVSGAVVTAACENGLVLPVQPAASPLTGYPEALGVSVEGRETDYEYAYNKVVKAAKERERAVSGQIPAVSMPIMMIKIAFDYSDMYCSEDTIGKLDAAVLNELAGDYADALPGRYVTEASAELNNCVTFTVNAVNL